MAKRLKRRYVVIMAEPRLSGDSLVNAVRSSYRELFGVFGLAISGFKAMKVYKNEGVAIIRCFLKYLPNLLLATASVTKLNGENVALRTLIISGTMKRAKEVAETYL
ncbi:MAG: hypothetical protein DRN49_01370 [Thaumarchaeota archaeon]|nr:MAG: hypothetical protein DRN49_01370 [Nitrososphaerota archaeon]